MTTESKREEALRFAQLAHSESQPTLEPEEIFPLTAEELERVVYLARQRKGWVWVPEEPTREMLLAILKSYEDRQLYTRKLRTSAEEYAADDWSAALAAAPKPEERK
jgi:hypothetical protein